MLSIRIRTRASDPQLVLLKSLPSTRMCSPLHSTRNLFQTPRNNTKRTTFRLPKVSSEVFRAKSTSPTCPNFLGGVSLDQLIELYTTRCHDLNIPVIPEQQSRFFSNCYLNLANRSFSLREFGLGETSAKVIGKILANSTRFSYVILPKNAIGDKGAGGLVQSLLRNKGIVLLDLTSNDISSEGTSRIFELLRNHRSLTSLNLGSVEGLNRNRVGVPGAISLARLLRMNNILTHLNISGTLLGNEGLLHLTEGLKNNKNLLSLNIGNNLLTGSIEKFLETLAGSRLLELGLNGNKLGNQGAEELANLIAGKYGDPPMLIKLDLSRISASSKGVSVLFDHLAKNRPLSSLNLEGNSLSSGISDNILTCLSMNHDLKSLNLGSCELSKRNLCGLGNGLAENMGLVTIVLSNNSITDEGAALISSGLADNSSLKNLLLNNNRIKVTFT